MTFVCLAYHAKYISLSFPLLHMTHFSQRGKEQEVIWRLLNKMQAKESVEVVSVFYIPKSPGRVYFEARSSEAVRTLCHGMVFLYFRSNVFVPITERMPLLEVGKSDPLIVAGSWVKVRNGRYEDDIRRVVICHGEPRHCCCGVKKLGKASKCLKLEAQAGAGAVLAGSLLVHEGQSSRDSAMGAESKTPTTKASCSRASHTLPRDTCSSNFAATGYSGSRPELPCVACSSWWNQQMLRRNTSSHQKPPTVSPRLGLHSRLAQKSPRFHCSSMLATTY